MDFSKEQLGRYSVQYVLETSRWTRRGCNQEGH